MVVGTELDLKLIDETYGNKADLYVDVLKVPTTATADEIQLAYFDRRSELFTLLAKIDAAAQGPRTEPSPSLASVDQKRYMAEKKMDSVVFAVRILADPALRKAYNGIRPERTGTAPTPGGYALKQSASASSRASSAASELSTKSGNKSKQQQQPRVVTPTESAVVTPSSSPSESKNWIQSTFSSSLFSSTGSSPSKTEDDVHEIGDEERNPRKSKRRQKQQQSSSLPNRDEPIQESEKEKKSIWGRKKRKKKKPRKEDPVGISLNDSMDTNATDTSLTDHEDTNYKNKNKISDTLESNTRREMSPQEAVRRGGERKINDRKYIEETDTVNDDDTRRDDDTRTYLGDDGETFATMSSYPEEQEGAGVCGDGDGMFGCLSGSKAFKSIANEVSGACEDTLVSVDQVFNAFTLTDKDIKAVTKKIDRAQRQLETPA